MPGLLWRLLALLVAAPAVLQATRPRGVRAELATLYNPASDFRCMDGSNTIPFIQVNDDYCDCEDGSDEPGTSACPRGRFYCENAGHSALVLPSGRVGDGVCDCCDGTDEWESGARCGNTCSELGRAAREAREAELKAHLEGFNLRRGMVEEAKRLQEEKVAELAGQETKRAELEAVRDLKEKEKEAVEAPEKEALDFYRKVEEEEKRKREELEKETADSEAAGYFQSLDTDGDGLVTVAELQARPGIDTNKDGEVSEEEAKFFLSDQEHFDMETFKTSGYVLLKPYLDLVPEGIIQEELDPVPEQEEEEEGTIPEVDWHPMATPEPPAADPNAPDHPMMTPPPPTYDEDDEYTADEDEDKEDEDYDVADREDDDDDDDLAAPAAPEKVEETKYDEVTQALVATAEAARKAFNDADRDLRDTEREIKTLKDVLEKDYGDENEFSVLNGQCFELTDNEYKYKMCPFDHCSQRPKHGGSETRLGSWGSWEGGEGGDKYNVMKFTGGQGCWNGPARSTTVHVRCGTDNVVLSVSEPNKCEYEMHFTSPAACRHHAGHDEL